MADSIDLETLTRMTTNQLKEQWGTLGVRGQPPHFKQAILRGISWHVQSKVHGGLDADTRRLLKTAIRNAPDPNAKKQDAKPRKHRESVKLSTGTTLVRTWRGHKHEVTVAPDGKTFRYRETEYASLSEIAREITGARWSGPRFFGLVKLKGVA